MSRLFIVAVPLVIAGVLGSCAGQRPIESVRADGDFAFRLQEYDTAAAYYQEIVDRRPGDWQAQHHLGRCRLELEEPDAARRALDIAYSIRPENDAVADALAEAMFRQGAENELFAFLRERADSRRDARSYLQLGRYSMELGDMDSASTAILTAIEVDEGRSVEPYLAAAELAGEIGDTDKVVRRLRQAYGINPNDTRVIRLLREYGEVPGPTIALPPGR